MSDIQENSCLSWQDPGNSLLHCLWKKSHPWSLWFLPSSVVQLSLASLGVLFCPPYTAWTSHSAISFDAWLCAHFHIIALSNSLNFRLHLTLSRLKPCFYFVFNSFTFYYLVSQICLEHIYVYSPNIPQHSHNWAPFPTHQKLFFLNLERQILCCPNILECVPSVGFYSVEWDLNLIRKWLVASIICMLLFHRWVYLSRQNINWNWKGS